LDLKYSGIQIDLTKLLSNIYETRIDYRYNRAGWILFGGVPVSKGYEVHGIVWKVAFEDPEHRLWRINHLLEN